MDIRKVNLSEINPAPYNPRKDLQPGDPEYEKLKRSLTEFDVVEPLVWNKRTGNLVGGHQRLKILKTLGITDIEVSVVDLPDERERALNVALNKISGDWDPAKLTQLVQDIQGKIDLSLTGFDPKELDRMLKAVQPAPGLTDPDQVPEKVETITKKGDLWVLGPHRLLCGDSTVVTDVNRLFQGNKAAVCITDPPYSVDYDRSQEERGGDLQAHSAYHEQDIDPTDLLKFLDIAPTDLLVMSYAVQRHIYKLCEALQRCGYEVKKEVIWAKDRFSYWRGAKYQMQHEPIWICSRNGKPFANSLIPPNESSVQNVPRPHKHDMHPTQKPIELWSKFVKYHSGPKDIVYEPFCGSGTTLISCEQLDRVCYAIELSEYYCDIIVKRWEDFTGKKAEREEIVQKEEVALNG